MARTGRACSANPATATPPLRGIRHGSVISTTSDDAGPEDDRLREEQARPQRRGAPKPAGAARSAARRPMSPRSRCRAALHSRRAATRRPSPAPSCVTAKSAQSRRLSGGGRRCRTVRRSRSTRSNASTTTAARPPSSAENPSGVRSSARSPGPSAVVSKYLIGPSCRGREPQERPSRRRASPRMTPAAFRWSFSFGKRFAPSEQRRYGDDEREREDPEHERRDIAAPPRSRLVNRLGCHARDEQRLTERRLDRRTRSRSRRHRAAARSREPAWAARGRLLPV